MNVRAKRAIAWGWVLVAGAVTMVAPLTLHADAPRLSGPVELRVDDLKLPLGIDDPAPRFSWQLRDKSRGAHQTAYKVIVASRLELLHEGNADVWDSGRINSGQSLNVRYAGPALAPFTRYFWRVRVWGVWETSERPYAESEAGWWETGLMTQDAWKAAWIGYETAEEAAVRNAPAKWIANPNAAPLVVAQGGEQHFAYRTTVKLGKPVRQATLFATAQDTVAAWVNGAQVMESATISVANQTLTVFQGPPAGEHPGCDWRRGSDWQTTRTAGEASNWKPGLPRKWPTCARLVTSKMADMRAISSLPRLTLLFLTTSAVALLTSCGSGSPSVQANSIKTTPTLTWPQPAAITAATALSATQLDATANVPGTFVYSPAAGTVPPAGTQLLTATFTPTDTAGYATATVSQTIVVNSGIKQKLTIRWSQPAPITAGTPLGPDQRNASAAVPGAFVYTPAAGTVLPQGMQTLSVTFTPADTVDYNAATASVPIIVNAANNPGGLGGDCATGLPGSGATFVYVSTGTFQTGPYQINGFSGAPDGSLRPVAGSPFTTPGIAWLNTNGAGSQLFGGDGYSIYSLAIHSDGCLSLENSTVFRQRSPTNPYLPFNLFFDRKNTTLYSFDFIPEEESTYASYNFDAGTGQLTLIGTTSDGLQDANMLAFDSSNRFAVTSGCFVRRGPVISEFQRNSDGTLSFLANGPLPATQQNVYPCTVGAAADHSHHFVIAIGPCQGGMSCQPVVPWQLAVYTIDDAGNLTTTSNPQNMATTVAEPGDFGGWYGFSPDDKFFAIAAYVGLDVFAWDSTNAVLTHIATINNTESSCDNNSCTGTSFGNIAWDGTDHLYTSLGQQLFVYTVTPSGVTPAPGSPYAVQNPAWVTVVNEE